MSEKQFEECSLANATHAETVTGKVYEISKHENRLRIVIQGYSVFIETWETLGIKPMREVKREPIEFDARFVKYDGKWHPLYSLDDGLSYKNCKTSRFRCVEILEDEE